MKLKKILTVIMTSAVMLGLIADAPSANTYASGIKEDVMPVSDEISFSVRETTAIAIPEVNTITGEAISVEIDYSTYTAILTSKVNYTYAFIKVYKAKKESGDEWIDFEGKYSGPYSYKFNGNTAKVDLSFLKGTSLQGLQVYGDGEEDNFTEVEINGRSAKLKGLKYENGIFIYKMDGEIAELENVLYEYRGEYGSAWTSLKEFKETNFSSAGGTIIIREKARQDGEKPFGPDTPGEIGTPAGLEHKVKITVAKKAPKITVDYVKNKINLKRGMEISIDGVNYINELLVDGATWQYDETGEYGNTESLDELIKTKSGITPQMIRNTFKVYSDEIYLPLFIRTPEIESENGKITPASDVTCVMIPPIDTLIPLVTMVSDSAAVNKETVKLLTDQWGAGIVSASFESTTGKNPKYTCTLSRNNSMYGSDFEYQIGENSGKWTKIKESGSKITLTNTPQVIQIRAVGYKDDHEFPSESITVTIPAKPAGTN